MALQSSFVGGQEADKEIDRSPIPSRLKEGNNNNTTLHERIQIRIQIQIQIQIQISRCTALGVFVFVLPTEIHSGKKAGEKSFLFFLKLMHIHIFFLSFNNFYPYFYVHSLILRPAKYINLYDDNINNDGI